MRDVRKGAVWAALGIGIALIGGIISFIEDLISSIELGTKNIGSLISIIGLVIQLIGVKKLSDNAQNEKDIFKNCILSGIFQLFALFVPIIILLYFVDGTSAITSFFINISIYEVEISHKLADIGISAWSVVIISFFVFAILTVIKSYKYLKSISIEYNIPLMKYVAIGYIFGFLLIPIFGIGLVILFVTFIVNIYAYLQIEKNRYLI